MNRYPLILLLLFFTTSNVYSQKDKSAPAANSLTKDQLFDLQKKIYDQAIKYNDLGVAREALYTMIALKPERNTLKDTLTYLYYNSGNNVQVVLLGREILEKNPDHAEVLELVAVSQQNLGLLKEALESFEKLFALSKNVYHRYNIASLQYMLKRYGECSENLNAIIGSTDEQGSVTISNNTGDSQQVPIKAAAFNMRGVIALEISQPDVAKQNFEKALELFPDFVLARNNLEKISGDKKAPEKKN